MSSYSITYIPPAFAVINYSQRMFNQAMLMHCLNMLIFYSSPLVAVETRVASHRDPVYVWSWLVSHPEDPQPLNIPQKTHTKESRVLTSNN